MFRRQPMPSLLSEFQITTYARPAISIPPDGSSALYTATASLHAVCARLATHLERLSG